MRGAEQDLLTRGTVACAAPSHFVVMAPGLYITVDSLSQPITCDGHYAQHELKSNAGDILTSTLLQVNCFIDGGRGSAF